MKALAHILRSDAPAPPESLEAWWAREQASPWTSSADRALVGGWEGGRMGWAFASGYQAAAAALFADRSQVWAMCATEDGGNHPRAIRTSLRGSRLYGAKAFVTLAEFATRLAVIFRDGEVDGRPSLRLAIVRAEDAEMQALPRLPMVPEIGHARCVLDGVEPLEVLDGDAYLGVLKPFRTIEDIHVLLAFCGLVLRYGAGRNRAASAAVALSALAERDPLDPAVHVALGGVFEDLDGLGPGIPEWARDGALLKIAGKARARRLERAWAQMSS